jgi:hypothetical protein
VTLSENPTADFLRTQLKINIDGFRVRRAASKKKAFLIRMAVVTLGALTTLLLGLKSNPVFHDCEDYMSAVALLFSAVIPVFAAWDAFYDHRWLWVRYTVAQQTLYGISDDMEFALTEGDLTKEKLEALYGRFRAALQETNSAWTERRTKIETGDPKA